MRSFTLLAGMLALGPGCPPSPAPPAPDASDAGPPTMRDAAPSPNATVYQRACANLADIACEEGVDANCAAVLEHATTARLTTYDLPCLTACKTKACVRGCGLHNVSCP